MTARKRVITEKLASIGINPFSTEPFLMIFDYLPGIYIVRTQKKKLRHLTRFFYQSELIWLKLILNNQSVAAEIDSHAGSNASKYYDF